MQILITCNDYPKFQNAISVCHVNNKALNHPSELPKTAFTAVFQPNYENLQKMGHDIVIFSGNVLGHAWQTWCKPGTNGKRMSCSLLICHMQIFKSIDFRTMGLWIWITFFYTHCIGNSVTIFFSHLHRKILRINNGNTVIEYWLRILTTVDPLCTCDFVLYINMVFSSLHIVITLLISWVNLVGQLMVG